MAKRKRLTPAQPAYLAEGQGAPERKSLLPVGPAPIAQVAGEAAASAALHEVSAELTKARSEGRLIQALALNSIEESYLVRDRMVTEADDMAALRESLSARGQQTPIEVVALDAGRYGLISGWRRLTALRQLSAQTGDSRFATVQALLRQPETAADAYLAMVEENEIRVGLSYYERARIVAKAAEKGVYSGEQTALRTLFSAASSSKRSKIGSFLAVYHALDSQLRHPSALSERLGLALAKALKEDPALGGRLVDRLRKSDVQSPEEEQAVLAKALKAASVRSQGQGAALAAPPAPSTLDKPRDAEEPSRGVYLQTGGGYLRPKFILSGPRVDQAFRDRLVDWLKKQGI